MIVFIHSFSFISASYYLPLSFQAMGASALLSGVYVIPFSLGSAFVSIVSGFILAKTGKYRVIITGALCFLVLGFSLMATLDSTSNRSVSTPSECRADPPSSAQQELYLIVAAIGVGPLFQAPLIALQAAMPIKDMATSTGAFGLTRSLGGTIGISVGGAIVGSQLNSRLSSVAGYTQPAGSSTADVSGLAAIMVRTPCLQRAVLTMLASHCAWRGNLRVHPLCVDRLDCR